MKDNFKHDKSLGQNFLSDESILYGIVDDAGIDPTDTVVEIGAGMGALTVPLSTKAREVYSYEVDERLTPILKVVEVNHPNVRIIMADAMRDSEPQSHVEGDYKVVANIPYYITTPLIMKYLEDTYAKSITVMIQKEVAERLVARAGTSDYGTITIAIDLVGDARITRYVGKEKFTPPPKVDSAVVHIDINRDKYVGIDRARVMKVVKCAFAMRRKTLLNNLISSYPISKDEATTMIESLGYSSDVRGERLTTEDYIKLSQMLYK